MKLSTIRHSCKEGLNNIIRHPLMTMASISTIALMLFILGAFTVFSINARSIMEKIGQQPPIELVLNLDVSSTERDQIMQTLDDDPSVLEHSIYSPEDNLASFKKEMGEEDLFEGFSASNLPYTISVRLTDPASGDSFMAQYGGVPGISKISMENSVMLFLSKAMIWINYATLIAFGVLFLVSLFIISNMVRVAVFSRGEEINIMKYIGASNWYIRFPYIIEGAFVGFTGGLIAFLSVLTVYSRIYNPSLVGDRQSALLSLLPGWSFVPPLILTCVILGMIIGSVGSAYSVRHYIKV